MEQAADPTPQAMTGGVVSIVSAYVGNNPLSIDDVPKLISAVAAALRGVSSEVVTETERKKPLEPAVPVRKSVTPDYIICLEDGAKLKTLKRYLRTHFDMSPDEYRERWGLPTSYPMIAPNYSAMRSELAKRVGLGSMRTREAPIAPTKRKRAAKAPS